MTETAETEYAHAEKLIGETIRCLVRPPDRPEYYIEGVIKRWRPADLRDRDGNRKRGAVEFLVRSVKGVNRWTPAVAPAEPVG